jgi:peroxiredoxin
VLYGLRTQGTEYQREMAERLELPFPVLSDVRLELIRALGLPTFEFQRVTLLKRFTLVIRDGNIWHIFYPVFPPDAHAVQVMDWFDSINSARCRPLRNEHAKRRRFIE